MKDQFPQSLFSTLFTKHHRIVRKFVYVISGCYKYVSYSFMILMICCLCVSLMSCTPAKKNTESGNYELLTPPGMESHVPDVSNSNSVSNNTSNMNIYRSILLGDAPLLYTADNGDTESMYINQVPGIFSPDDIYAVVYKFTIVDLNQDGEREVVLWTTSVSNEMGGFMILYGVEDKVYGFPSRYRTFIDLKTDGTFVYTDPTGAAEEVVCRVELSKDGYTINKIMYALGIPEEGEFNSFFIGDQPVTKEEYDVAFEKQEEKPSAVWYDFTNININTLFD